MSDPCSTILTKQKSFYHTGATKSLDFRLTQLQRLAQAVTEAEQDVLDALKQDFSKPAHETFVTEIGFLLTEIRHTIKHLKTWVKPTRVKNTLTHIGSKGYIVPEPYGVALILSPWNYPFQLALGPLIGAIAAGNCAVIKPSELTPATSALIARLCKTAFPEEYIAVIEGGVETSTKLLEQPFDMIFFTGSTAVGKIVAQSAAKQLIPVVLELGGKSPVIVHKDANLTVAAKRIMWGKYLNAGQTCVAPDYILAHRSIKPALIEELSSHIHSFYGDVLNPDDDGSRYPSIVNDRHYDRLNQLLQQEKAVYGGRTNKERRIIEPTLLDEVSWNSPIMKDEIFGPLLPILEYEDLDAVIKQINSRDKPLALYLFTEDKNIQDKVIHKVSFGGGCINDTIMHLATPYLPFGGVGASGTGAYHGKFSFEAFSHKKSVLKQTTRFDPKWRYINSWEGLAAIKRFLK